MLLQEFEFDTNTLSSGDVKTFETKSFKGLGDWMKKNCSNYLNIVKQSGDYLYRGVKDADNLSEIFIAKPREDRKSVESHNENDATAIAANRADNYMRLGGFSALRRNSIFCTSDTMIAAGWGSLYVIFPINGFTFGYSREHNCCTARDYELPNTYFKQQIRTVCGNIVDIPGSGDIEFHKLMRLTNRLYNARGYAYEDIYVVFNAFIKEFELIAKTNTQFNKFNKEVQKLKKLSILSELELAKQFIDINELTNEDLGWAIKRQQDCWIHGAYIAIDINFFKKNKINNLLKG